MPAETAVDTPANETAQPAAQAAPTNVVDMPPQDSAPAAGNEQSETSKPATSEGPTEGTAQPPVDDSPAAPAVEEIGNKNHAEQWFSRHSSGTCIVRGADSEKTEVSSYPEACAFFDKHGEN